MARIETFSAAHDPDGREDWAFVFALGLGETLTAATLVVTDRNGIALATTDLVLERVAFGQISGSLWGVLGWISGGGALSDYHLACIAQTSTTPVARRLGRLARLRCAIESASLDRRNRLLMPPRTSALFVPEFSDSAWTVMNGQSNAPGVVNVNTTSGLLEDDTTTGNVQVGL